MGGNVAKKDNNKNLQLSLPGTTEQIRVQSSEKERSVPKEVPARSTLHVRMYARRKGWVVGVTKMMWRGFLAMMEDTCKGITDCITIIADDRSRKNLQVCTPSTPPHSTPPHPPMQVHKSICLCAFFVECRSVAKAQAFRSMVHDKRTVNDDGGIFLIQCDYTLSNKKLHDTCKNKDSLVRNYNQELRAAKQFAERGYANCEASTTLSPHPYHQFSPPPQRRTPLAARRNQLL